ncbi:MAG: hypothetical protein WBC60_09950 [Cognaticolwellia sp.]
MINLKSFRVILLTFAIFGSYAASAHDSHTHSAPWQACENKQKSAQCSFTNGDDDLFKGSCQVFTDTLMCVRNQPIIHVETLDKKLKEKAKKVTGVDLHN